MFSNQECCIQCNLLTWTPKDPTFKLIQSFQYYIKYYLKFFENFWSGAFWKIQILNLNSNFIKINFSQPYLCYISLKRSFNLLSNAINLNSLAELEKLLGHFENWSVKDFWLIFWTFRGLYFQNGLIFFNKIWYFS